MSYSKRQRQWTKPIEAYDEHAFWSALLHPGFRDWHSFCKSGVRRLLSALTKVVVFLLISAAVQGQSEGQKVNPVLKEESKELPLWIKAGDTVLRHELHFDTIPGVIQLVDWSEREPRVRWIEGYMVNPRWETGTVAQYIKFMSMEFHYLTADKKPLPENVTVALFVKKPER